MTGRRNLFCAVAMIKAVGDRMTSRHERVDALNSGRNPLPLSQLPPSESNHQQTRFSDTPPLSTSSHSPTPSIDFGQLNIGIIAPSIPSALPLSHATPSYYATPHLNCTITRRMPMPSQCPSASSVSTSALHALTPS